MEPSGEIVCFGSRTWDKLDTRTQPSTLITKINTFLMQLRYCMFCDILNLKTVFLYINQIDYCSLFTLEIYLKQKRLTRTLHKQRFGLHWRNLGYSKDHIGKSYTNFKLDFIQVYYVFIFLPEHLGIAFL